MNEIKITYEDIVAEFGPDFLEFDDEESHNDGNIGLDSHFSSVLIRMFSHFLQRLAWKTSSNDRKNTQTCLPSFMVTSMKKPGYIRVNNMVLNYDVSNMNNQNTLILSILVVYLSLLIIM